MAKLALLALTLTAIVALASVVSAYRTTIITTTTIDENRRGGSQGGQCRMQIPMEQLSHCQMHLAEGIMSRSDEMNPRRRGQQEHLQQCCSQLNRVSGQCQCEAIQQVFDQARQQGDVMEMRQMLSKAQRLPTDCRLEVQDCPIRSPRVV
ncbi:hypothetical protein SSX86_031155 [Deinandra increscens subsp. villosa]|uniref:Bifunctional inhibitor/plant lipid transfer protein/seed storage helical domain-containing protein n=1 Tax=Deinandra increscens subsp. villosa TaxID=3103831 RepID=A0AAP0GHX5_9ASTR